MRNSVAVMQCDDCWRGEGMGHGGRLLRLEDKSFPGELWGPHHHLLWNLQVSQQHPPVPPR